MKKRNRCTARNTAGFRCEHRAKKHPTQDGRPLHKVGGEFGSVVWSEPQGHTASRVILDEVHGWAILDETDSRAILDEIGSWPTSSDPTLDKKWEQVVFNSGRPEPGMTGFRAPNFDVQMEDPPVTAEDYFRAAPSPTEVLTEWWLAQARDEIERTVPKAVEYGSTDLVDIGRNIARLAHREVADDEAEELGIYFYLEGKFARWRSAIMEGRRVSDDTMFDIGVYVRMAQRVRHAGNWPGIDMGQLAQDPNDIMHSMCTEPCGLGCTAPDLAPAGGSTLNREEQD